LASISLPATAIGSVACPNPRPPALRLRVIGLPEKQPRHHKAAAAQKPRTECLPSPRPLAPQRIRRGGQLFATWARLELLGGTSDLSWLNPTPHAIAVYASRPLSASSHATLATKRTLLLTWTGLPPAGSRQLCLAHSLDHSSASARRVDGVNWRRRHRPMHRHYRL
jgi:hypothetical protein